MPTFDDQRTRLGVAIWGQPVSLLLLATQPESLQLRRAVV